MDVSALNNLYKTTPATDSYVAEVGDSDADFTSVFEAAMNMVDETNALQNEAQNEEIKFALGESENTHDLMIAEQKANVALQYTVAVRDKFLTSYNTIMNMQI